MGVAIDDAESNVFTTVRKPDAASVAPLRVQLCDSCLQYYGIGGGLQPGPAVERS